MRVQGSKPRRDAVGIQDGGCRRGGLCRETTPVKHPSASWAIASSAATRRQGHRVEQHSTAKGQSPDVDLGCRHRGGLGRHMIADTTTRCSELSWRVRRATGCLLYTSPSPRDRG